MDNVERPLKADTMNTWRATRHRNKRPFLFPFRFFDTLVHDVCVEAAWACFKMLSTRPGCLQDVEITTPQLKGLFQGRCVMVRVVPKSLDRPSAISPAGRP